jgi:hypothetical protein
MRHSLRAPFRVAKLAAPFAAAVTVGLAITAGVTVGLAITAGPATASAAPRGTAPAADASAAGYTSRYACDLSRYGYTGSPVTATATLTLRGASQSATTVHAKTGLSAVALGGSATAEISVSPVSLPSSVAAKLKNLAGVQLRTLLGLRGAAEPNALLNGYATVGITSPLTRLWGNATGPLFFSKPGTAWVEPPASSLRFTPYRRSGSKITSLPSIICTASPGQATSITMTVTGQPVKAPVYACSYVLGDLFGDRFARQYTTPLPVSVTVSGTRTVGSTVAVTLSSPQAGLADPAPGAATELNFYADLLVDGTAPGLIQPQKTTKNADATTFTASARLKLTRKGTVKIFFPSRLLDTVFRTPGNRLDYFCTPAASAVPVALAFSVSA